MKTEAFGGTSATNTVPAPAPSPEQQEAQNNAQRQIDAKAFGDNPDPQAGNPNKPIDPAVKAAADKAEAAAKAKQNAKAAKDAKAPTADGSDGSNTPAEESDNFKALRETAKGLGQTEGAGVNSRAELAVQVAQATRDGILNPSKKSPDLANIWQEFQDARAAARMDSGGKDDNGEKASVNSAKVQISKLRVFAKASAPDRKFDFTRVLARARDLINKEAGKKNSFLVTSTFEALVEVARAHAKPSCEKGMTNPELIALLQGGEEAELPSKDEYELATLNAIYKRCEKLQEGTDDYAPCDSDDLQRAMNALRGRIVPLTDQLKKEKEAERAAQQPPPVSPPANQVGNAA